MIVDTVVIAQKLSDHNRYLADDGTGAAATAYEEAKSKKYSHLTDFTQYDFLPFVMEVQWGFGERAKAFMLELDKKKGNARQHVQGLSKIEKGVLLI